MMKTTPKHWKSMAKICHQKRTRLNATYVCLKKTLEQKCVVCMDNTCDTILHHGQTTHICTCKTCAEKMFQCQLSCPICRQTIDGMFILDHALIQQYPDLIHQSLDRKIPQTDLKLSSLQHYTI